MVCASCGRRCDPNRSFCTHCGCSVFMDESAKPAFSASPVSRSSSVSATSRQLRALQRSAQSIDRTAVANATKRARKAAAATAAQPFRFVPLIKFAVFVFIVWNAVGWLLRIAEVRALKDAIQTGQVSDEVVRAAGEALRARIDAALGGTPAPASPPPSTPVGRSQRPQQPEQPGVERIPAATNAAPASVLVAPPDTAILPPGVSRPGVDVTLPQVLQMVDPVYTPEARRAKVEGTVVLRAVVRTHGRAVDISVVRSLDQRFGLDQQALAALHQWRFAPGERLGRPVPVLVQVEMEFSLR